MRLKRLVPLHQLWRIVSPSGSNSRCRMLEWCEPDDHVGGIRHASARLVPAAALYDFYLPGHWRVLRPNPGRTQAKAQNSRERAASQEWGCVESSHQNMYPKPALI